MALGRANSRGVVGLQQGHLPVQSRERGCADRNRESNAQGFCVAWAPAAGGLGGLGHVLPCQALTPQPASSSRCRLSQAGRIQPLAVGGVGLSFTLEQILLLAAAAIRGSEQGPAVGRDLQGSRERHQAGMLMPGTLRDGGAAHTALGG